MKTVLNNFRSTEAEKARWESALNKEGRNLSDICRAALNRFVARVEKKEGAGE